MNLALILKLLDGLFAEGPKSKGHARNLSRATLLGICATILFYVRPLPEKVSALDVRLARVEARLGVASLPSPVSSASHTNVTLQEALTPAGARVATFQTDL